MARNFLTSALLQVSRSRLMYAGGLTSLATLRTSLPSGTAASSAALS
jgi:hypothetical protein